ncbi:alpha/beta fold hydrolase [Occallatibacter riparius]|uniref:Alpha/beta hydrolase n=1 Tax=Occallatibacter riparius TaxID=1002689 RepID=A0A9J7BN66_9BACT|nr:alpha/beta hydrolase [Occallatibacter riparius]UWZ82621.1 alpha/beta hydrolase [Occallatibacter riparius]
MLRTLHPRALIVLFAIGIALPGLAVAQKPAGANIDAGGYRVFTAVSGSGSPTVVFVAGLGEDSSTWDKVAPEVAKFSRTFVYDRAGLGKSQDAPGPKDMDQMLNELHTVLRNSGLKPPYVLVGHSLGGAIVEIYAHRYADEIAGLVLVDPEDGRLLELLHAHLDKADWDARQQMLEKMMAAASPAQKAELEASKESGKLVENSLPLPAVPTVLLTGTLKDPGFPGNPMEQDLKMQLHKELLAQSPEIKQVLAPNSRHYVQEDAPELVIQAIRHVADQTRTGSPKRNPAVMTKEKPQA